MQINPVNNEIEQSVPSFAKYNHTSDIPARVIRVYKNSTPGWYAEKSPADELNDAYDRFARNYFLAPNQNLSLANIFRQILATISESDFHCNLDLEMSVEHEVVISRRSSFGITYIAIDDDGDLMLSHANFEDSKKDMRLFYDFNEQDPERIGYQFLSKD